MALAAGLHGAVRLNFCRAGKIGQFGVNFKVRIIVDSEVIKPFRKISGKVVIETRFPIKHKGLLIQFEGMCTLRYATKFDNRTTFHQCRQNILDTKPDLSGYQESPIRDIILPEHATEDAGAYCINPGTVTYPQFSFDIPGDPHLPSPFKNSFGNLVYRLVVYMKSTTGVPVEIGEKVMRFNGHHNLLDNVEAMVPISLDNSYKKSMFNRKRLVETVFSVDTSGYLPEESIPFILFIKNPKCIPLQLNVQLLQHLKFDASGRIDSAKRKCIIVALREKDDYEPEPESTWVDKLPLRESLEPTFTAHYMYHVTYSLQYKVKILDHGTIKGEAPIFIGTTRDPIQVLMNNAHCLGVDVNYDGAEFRRRASSSSAHSVRSHNSASSTYSLPPAYSQLSSRIPSLETLPPTYDEAEQFEFENRERLEGLTIEVPNIISASEEQEQDSVTIL